MDTLTSTSTVIVSTIIIVILFIIFRLYKERKLKRYRVTLQTIEVIKERLDEILKDDIFLPKGQPASRTLSDIIEIVGRISTNQVNDDDYKYWINKLNKFKNEETNKFKKKIYLDLISSLEKFYDDLKQIIFELNKINNEINQNNIRDGIDFVQDFKGSPAQAGRPDETEKLLGELYISSKKVIPFIIQLKIEIDLYLQLAENSLKNIFWERIIPTVLTGIFTILAAKIAHNADSVKDMNDIEYRQDYAILENTQKNSIIPNNNTPIITENNEEFLPFVNLTPVENQIIVKNQMPENIIFFDDFLVDNNDWILFEEEHIAGFIEGGYLRLEGNCPADYKELFCQNSYLVPVQPQKNVRIEIQSSAKYKTPAPLIIYTVEVRKNKGISYSVSYTSTGKYYMNYNNVISRKLIEETKLNDPADDEKNIKNFGIDVTGHLLTPIYNNIRFDPVTDGNIDNEGLIYLKISILRGNSAVIEIDDITVRDTSD